MKQTPLWRDANALLLEVEQAVRKFPRYHKYALGTDLRRGAMGVMRLIIRAFNEQADRRRQVKRLILALDDLKVQIQLARELRAFENFQQFQRISALAVGLGRQSGHWLKKLEQRNSGRNGSGGQG